MIKLASDLLAKCVKRVEKTLLPPIIWERPEQFSVPLNFGVTQEHLSFIGIIQKYCRENRIPITEYACHGVFTVQSEMCNKALFLRKDQNV
jgi:hypothetical protein